MTSRIVLCAGIVALGLAVTIRESKADYAFTDLGPVTTGAQGHGNAVNATGMVAGTSYMGSQSTAFYVAAGSAAMQSVATLGGISNTGLAINDSGQITGSSQISSSISHAYLSTGSSVSDLGTLTGSGSSTGYGVNNLGVVVGQSTASVGQHAFIDASGSMRDLGTLGGTTSAAYAINGSGHVVGTSVTSLAGSPTHGFYYDGSTMRDIGSFGTGLSSYAQAINGVDHVAGYAVNSQGYSQAFIDTTPTVSNNLRAIVGFASVVQSFGNGINDSDAVVGEAQLSSGVFHAFLWTPSGGMVDLNDLLPTGSNWVLNDALSINDLGEITGYFTIDPGAPDQQIHAFFYGPAVVPCPPSLLLMALGGMLSAAGLQRVTGRKADLSSKWLDQGLTN